MPNIDNAIIAQFIFFMLALVFSLSVHESAHAWTSNYFGDDLARLQGRISLNPIAHVDPVGTLLFPALAFFTGLPFLGWAKPTPVNPLRWRDKRAANFWVSVAGVICNAVIAIVAGVILRAMDASHLVALYPHPYYGLVAFPQGDSLLVEGAAKLLTTFYSLNVGLAIFNLLPIPPLDGSKVLSSILPPSFESGLEALERFGFILLIVAMYTGILGVIFRLVMPLASYPFLIGLS